MNSEQYFYYFCFAFLNYMIITYKVNSKNKRYDQGVGQKIIHFSSK